MLTESNEWHSNNPDHCGNCRRLSQCDAQSCFPSTHAASLHTLVTAIGRSSAHLGDIFAHGLHIHGGIAKCSAYHVITYTPQTASEVHRTRVLRVERADEVRVVTALTRLLGSPIKFQRRLGPRHITHRCSAYSECYPWERLSSSLASASSTQSSRHSR
jgi:hypothetical protein